MSDKKQMIKEWKPILDKYEPIKVLGSGSYGQVIEAVNKATKKKSSNKKSHRSF